MKTILYTSKNISQGKKDFSNQYDDDILFVKIDVEKDDARFKKGATSYDKSNAFKELGKKSRKIEISCRCPKETCENKGFYGN